MSSSSKDRIYSPPVHKEERVMWLRYHVLLMEVSLEMVLHVFKVLFKHQNKTDWDDKTYKAEIKKDEKIALLNPEVKCAEGLFRFNQVARKQGTLKEEDVKDAPYMKTFDKGLMSWDWTLLVMLVKSAASKWIRDVGDMENKKFQKKIQQFGDMRDPQAHKELKMSQRVFREQWKVCVDRTKLSIGLTQFADGSITEEYEAMFHKKLEDIATMTITESAIVAIAKQFEGVENDALQMMVRAMRQKVPSYDGKDAKDVRSVLRSAIEHRKNGEFDDALNDLTSVVSKTTIPDGLLSTVYEERAKVHKARDNRKTALRDIDRAIELNTHNYSAYTLRGHLHFDEEQYDIAISDGEIALCYDVSKSEKSEITKMLSEAQRALNAKDRGEDENLVYMPGALFEASQDESAARAGVDRGVMEKVREELMKSKSPSADLKAFDFLMRAFKCEEDGEFDKAFNLFLQAANRGNANAMCSLAIYYTNGRGSCAKDNAQAITWLKKAVLQREYLPTGHVNEGVARAHHSIALRYYEGRGFPKDMELAIEHWTKSAALREGAAYNCLGLMYAKGYHFDRDVDVAFQHYATGAYLGCTEAMRTMCVYNMFGLVKRPNLYYAMLWAQRAENSGMLGIASLARYLRDVWEWSAKHEGSIAKLLGLMAMKTVLCEGEIIFEAFEKKTSNDCATIRSLSEDKAVLLVPAFEVMLRNTARVKYDVVHCGRSERNVSRPLDEDEWSEHSTFGERVHRARQMQREGVKKRDWKRWADGVRLCAVKSLHVKQAPVSVLSDVNSVDLAVYAALTKLDAEGHAHEMRPATIAKLKKLVQAYPHEPVIRLLLAQNLCFAGATQDHECAIQHCRKALKQVDGELRQDYVYNLATMLRLYSSDSNNATLESKMLYEEFIDTCDKGHWKVAEAWYGLALIAFDNSDYMEQVRCVQKGLSAKFSIHGDFVDNDSPNEKLLCGHMMEVQNDALWNNMVEYRFQMQRIRKQQKRLYNDWKGAKQHVDANPTAKTMTVGITLPHMHTPSNIVLHTNAEGEQVFIEEIVARDVEGMYQGYSIELQIVSLFYQMHSKSLKYFVVRDRRGDVGLFALSVESCVEQPCVGVWIRVKNVWYRKSRDGEALIRDGGDIRDLGLEDTCHWCLCKMDREKTCVCGKCGECFYCSAKCRQDDGDAGQEELCKMYKEERMCAYCKDKKGDKKCSTCKGSFYCSVQCQKKDWKRHKEECRKYY